MKTQSTFLGICLLGLGIVNAQTPQSTYSASTPTVTSTAKLLAKNDVTRTSESSTNSEEVGHSTDFATVNTYPATRPEKAKDYKNFTFGIYAGLNSTKLKGESVNTSGDISGRLGYQAGLFIRTGGRVFGQLGAEYFASSSNYFTPGDGQNVSQIQDQINIQYVQIPLYVGYKLVQSERGALSVRLQAGLEYANRISSSSGKFNLTNEEIKSGTFNALGQLGFDFGPVFIDLTYHHGLSDAIKNPVSGNNVSTGFAGSQRRIASASFGFRF